MATQPIDQALRLGQEHHRAGRLVEAEGVYRQILTRNPRHIDALVSLGALTLQAGRRAESVALFSKVIGVRPNDPWTYLTIGQVLHVYGALDDAALVYGHALELFPASDEVHYRLGHVERRRGNLLAAIERFRRAIALRPGFPEALNNLGLVLEEAGQSEEAVRQLQLALRVDPDRPEAHFNLAISLTTLGRLEDAVAAYQRAVALNPNYTEAYNNLGAAQKALGHLDAAASSFETAVRTEPTWPISHSNLAGVYEWQARHDDALEAHRSAIELAPDSPGTHGNSLFTLLFHPEYDEAALRYEHAGWNLRHARPLLRSIEPHANDRTPLRRLRVGYVCGLFRDHVLGRYLAPLLREHDAAAVEVICYSNNRMNDAMTAGFRQMAAAWRDIGALSDDDAARLIRHDRVDVLVDTTLHMEGNRLLVFARKPAPVQVTFAGYPGSTGLEAMGYRLTDVHLDPPGMHDAAYVEKSWRLRDTFWCYDPLHANVAVTALPAASNGHVTFGSLNNFSKINERVLRLWAQVLGAVPGSHLFVLAHEGSHRQRARSLLGELGIEADRIEFGRYRPRNEYLELFQRIDISLDTVPYNGHTTSLDSLWMGVPVVTLVGSTVVGRAGASQLMNLRLPELIARTPDEYVAIASALAGDRARLSDLRRTLRSRMECSPLMDAPRFARNIEAAYRQMWQRWCAGLEPSAGPWGQEFQR